MPARNGLIAISYAARKFGISRHETVEAAQKLCPEIQLVHVATYAEGAEKAEYNEDPRPETHKVSLDPYRRESRKIVAIFNELCPLGAVEKASIDELYVDLTLAARQLILQRFPELTRPPSDSPLGLDTPLPPPPKIDWTHLGYKMPTTPSRAGEEEIPVLSNGDTPPPSAQPQSTAQDNIDDAKHPSPEPEEPIIEQAASWADYALACGAELIYKVRQEVIRRLGYTMSSGISVNKTLAKLSASQRKPNGQTVMLPAAIPIYLKDLPFKKIRFLGGKLGEAIATEWESSTVGDLWNVSLTSMQQKFGDESRWVHDVLRGIDHSAVVERTANKTMLASKNVKPPIRTAKEAQRWLSILSLELCVRLKEAREESPNMWPSTLVLRYLRPTETARSRQSNFGFVKDLKPEHIQTIAERLWNDALGEQMASGKPLDVIVIALGFSGLEAGEQGQRSIEGFFSAGRAGSSNGVQRSAQEKSAEAGPSEVKSPVAGSMLPPLKRATPSDHQATPPSGMAAPATTLSAVRKTKKVKPNGLESLFGKAAAAASSASSPVPPSQADVVSTATSPTPPPDASEPHSVGKDSSSPDAAIPDPRPSWICPGCSARIVPLPRSQVKSDGTSEDQPEESEEDVQRRLFLARQDHEDYHFALNLEKEARAAFMPRGSLSSSQAPAASQSQGPSSLQRKGNGSAKKAKGGIANFFKKGA